MKTVFGFKFLMNTGMKSFDGGPKTIREGIRGKSPWEGGGVLRS